MSSRLAVMDKGVAVQIDQPKGIFFNPSNQTVATFIGTPAMNILPARVILRSGGVKELEVAGLRIPVPNRHYDRLGGCDQAEVGLRPQSIRLVKPSSETINGKILLKEPLGLEDEFLVEAAEGQRLVVVARDDLGIDEEQEVGLAFDPSDLYVFHTGTRETLCCGID